MQRHAVRIAEKVWDKKNKERVQDELKTACSALEKLALAPCREKATSRNVLSTSSVHDKIDQNRRNEMFQHIVMGIGDLHLKMMSGRQAMQILRACKKIS